MGSRCRAVYDEDGQIYEAIIASLNSEAETCVVRYVGYGNEEEKSIVDLLPSVDRGHHHSTTSETAPSEVSYPTLSFCIVM